MIFLKSKYELNLSKNVVELKYNIFHWNIVKLKSEGAENINT